MLDRRRQVCIISFIGPVGVGKSTYIRLLRNFLKSNNIRTVQTFINSGHVLAYILSKCLIALGISEQVSYPEGFIVVQPRRDIMRALFPLWCFLDSVSIAVKFFFTVYFPFCLGFTVLIEEGPTMTLQSYGMSIPHFLKTKPRVLPLLPNLIGWIMNKNHFNFVLDARNEELDQRRRHRGYRPHELAEYVAMQKKWMRHLDFGNTIFIDTSGKSIVQVRKKIITALEGYICVKNATHDFNSDS